MAVVQPSVGRLDSTNLEKSPAAAVIAIIIAIIEHDVQIFVLPIRLTLLTLLSLLRFAPSAALDSADHLSFSSPQTTLAEVSERCSKRCTSAEVDKGKQQQQDRQVRKLKSRQGISQSATESRRAASSARRPKSIGRGGKQWRKPRDAKLAADLHTADRGESESRNLSFCSSLGKPATNLCLVSFFSWSRKPPGTRSSNSSTKKVAKTIGRLYRKYCRLYFAHTLYIASSQLCESVGDVGVCVN